MADRDELVTHYWLNYDVKSNQVRVSIKTEDRGWVLAAEVAPPDALYLSDMLRNEDPIYASFGSDDKPKNIHTKAEEVGEGE
ncbi:MAG: hypothetical protein NXI22_04590 [bacterium]|nr:hypothetical protein [bacterium]